MNTDNHLYCHDKLTYDTELRKYCLEAGSLFWEICQLQLRSLTFNSRLSFFQENSAFLIVQHNVFANVRFQHGTCHMLYWAQKCLFSCLVESDISPEWVINPKKAWEFIHSLLLTAFRRLEKSYSPQTLTQGQDHPNQSRQNSETRQACNMSTTGQRQGAHTSTKLKPYPGDLPRGYKRIKYHMFIK